MTETDATSNLTCRVYSKILISLQKNLWGINLYLERPASEWIEFDSMINVRSSGGNRSRYVECVEVREAMIAIANRLVQG